ncbi:hypothetical protein HK105_209486, partial [Polyrhizophydium stewartii]
MSSRVPDKTNRVSTEDADTVDPPVTRAMLDVAIHEALFTSPDMIKAFDEIKKVMADFNTRLEVQKTQVYSTIERLMESNDRIVERLDRLKTPSETSLFVTASDDEEYTPASRPVASQYLGPASLDPFDGKLPELDVFFALLEGLPFKKLADDKKLLALLNKTKGQPQRMVLKMTNDGASYKAVKSKLKKAYPVRSAEERLASLYSCSRMCYP